MMMAGRAVPEATGPSADRSVPSRSRSNPEPCLRLLGGDDGPGPAAWISRIVSRTIETKAIDRDQHGIGRSLEGIRNVLIMGGIA